MSKMRMYLTDMGDRVEIEKALVGDTVCIVISQLEDLQMDDHLKITCNKVQVEELKRVLNEYFRLH